MSCVLVSRNVIAQESFLEASNNEIAICEISRDVYSLAEAQRLYETGCYHSAATMLESVSAQGDALTKAVAFSNLSLTYQKLGRWEEAAIAIQDAFDQIILIDKENNPAGVQAQTLDVQGQLQLALGEGANAAESWKLASELYSEMGDESRAISSKLNQIQALQSLGLFHQVKAALLETKSYLDERPDSEVKAIALRQLADSLWMTGNTQIKIEESSSNNEEETIDVNELFKMSVGIATRLEQQDLSTATQLSFGNFHRHQFLTAPDPLVNDATRHLTLALYSYQQASQSPIESVRIQALLNQLSLRVSPDVDLFNNLSDRSRLQSSYCNSACIENIFQQTPTRLYAAVRDDISNLGIGQQTIYAYVGLVDSLLEWEENPDRFAEALALLSEAENYAIKLQDKRSLSYIQGTKGHLYELQYDENEQAHTLDTAEIQTRQALSQSQSIGSQDISYQWQWQLGRILKKRNDRESAIFYYTQAFETLQNIRTDLISANIDQRFSFRDNIEPIYRELVKLLLPQDIVQGAKGKSASKSVYASGDGYDKLNLVRRVMDALQVAELENFFQAACLDTKSDLGETLQAGDAGLYPVILDNRLEVVLQLRETDSEDTEPSYTLRRYSSQIDNGQGDIKQLIGSIRKNLDSEEPGNLRELKEDSQKLYEYMFGAIEVGVESETRGQTLEAALSESNLKTLIFVLDGPLRNIPLSILYDGDKYLIDKYAIALNLGIEVRESEPLPKDKRLGVLAAGLETSRDADPGQRLFNVPDELDRIEKNGASVTRLENDSFTKEAFNEQLNKGTYQVVHLATHGQFSSNREKTFIKAANDEINLSEMSNLFRRTQSRQKPVELIVFTACRTATGDNEAVLGLAGATVQAGARSSIAALWNLTDSVSPEFTDAFYHHLNEPDTNRAVALQEAMLALKDSDYGDEDSHYDVPPRRWAPYVLIGSWR